LTEDDDDEDDDENPPRRRLVMVEEAAAGADTEKKILVLGGTGFLGSEIVKQAAEREEGVTCVATSSADLDLTAADAEDRVAEACRGCVGVISAVGSMGTAGDLKVNAAAAAAARGAKRAGVRNFVAVGNSERVRGVARSVPFLRGYAAGKEESERVVRELFGYRGCIVQPSFIYGGDKFGLSPPRVASPVGRILEEVLGLYPIQALSKALPDLPGAALEPPVSVENVAAACLNVALGLCEGYDVLNTKDAIVMAATSNRKRGCVDEEECSIEEYEETARQREELKRLLRTPDSGHDSIALMEDLELLRPSSTKPAHDARLNGRWNFVLSKSDLGTAFAKELQREEFSPVQLLFAVKDLYMEIGEEQTKVSILVKSRILGLPADVIITTSLLPCRYDEETDGTLFVEQFQGIRVAGIDLPIPASWQRSRYLEIGYLDDDMIIARGNGGEPHFLLRG
jgi:hypothetical protein